MMNYKTLLILPFLFLFSNTVFSQACCLYDIKEGRWIAPDGGPCLAVIFAGDPFLRIVPDARSGGMGDAGIATSTDANAMHFNDSKLAFSKKDASLSVTYKPWFGKNAQEVFMLYLTGYKKLSKVDAVGLSLRFFNYGDMSFHGEGSSITHPKEFEIKGSYSRQLSNKFSVAVGAKYYFSNLIEKKGITFLAFDKGHAFAADLSLTYLNSFSLFGKNTDLTVGMALTNLGTNMSYENVPEFKRLLPANAGVGAGLKIDLHENHSLTLATGIDKLLIPLDYIPHVRDGDPKTSKASSIEAMADSFSDSPEGFNGELKELMFSLGLEYWYKDKYALRVGYHGEDESMLNKKYYTTGLGTKFRNLKFDVSYEIPVEGSRNDWMYNDENKFRFTLMYDFPKG